MGPNVTIHYSAPQPTTFLCSRRTWGPPQASGTSIATCLALTIQLVPQGHCPPIGLIQATWALGPDQAQWLSIYNHYVALPGSETTQSVHIKPQAMVPLASVPSSLYTLMYPGRATLSLCLSLSLSSRSGPPLRTTWITDPGRF